MRVSSIHIVVLFSYGLSCNFFVSAESYNEELFIRPLATGYVYTFFQFTVVQENNQFKHSNLFPHSLGDIINRFNVNELNIDLTSGLWRHKAWGYPAIDAPSGAEISARFHVGTADVNKNWYGLTNALSGLLCTSLNFINRANSYESSEDTLYRYSNLPRENVCTENLTPWKKLLPCDSTRGLSSLLNSGKVHNANYHSLGIHFRPLCNGIKCVYELRQTVSLVYDSSFISFNNNYDWSLRRMFGTGLFKTCPLAETSKLYLDTSSNLTVPYTISQEPDYFLNEKIAVYNLKGIFHLAASVPKPKFVVSELRPILYTDRFITGFGQEYGGLVTRIYNEHVSPVTVTIIENIPWFLPIYYHTLKVTCNGFDLVPKALKYKPGKGRTRIYYLEIALELAAQSVTEISVQFDYVFLKWQEYPPDANHGFYIGSSTIIATIPRHVTPLTFDKSLIVDNLNSTNSDYIISLKTENFIITLPTPDFSMPYNVICLACTVVALAFGPIHNITTKRLKLTTAKYVPGLASVVQKLYMWLENFVFRKKSDKTGKTAQVKVFSPGELSYHPTLGHVSKEFMKTQKIEELSNIN
ncbi:GPI transamidase component PIG-T [Daktulosphaira vitifoliae]|uniref:GPI transamidase component PIG-T n=1 Tax=Daktulosphaira vitifoliae TaxID=58002 RepID=UPI0021A994C6|nr:GPI transamidase component PIG-T [Daktulosphaira vitifoliae]